MTDKANPYADILHLPHHKSPNRPHMSMHDCAAQFSPFPALTQEYFFPCGLSPLFLLLRS